MKLILKKDSVLVKPFTLPAYFDGPVVSIEAVLLGLKNAGSELAEQFKAKSAVFEKMLSGYRARLARRAESGCRAMGCTSLHRGGRTNGCRGGKKPSGSARKNARGAQLFCGTHSGLARMLGNDNCAKLRDNPYLRVVVQS